MPPLLSKRNHDKTGADLHRRLVISLEPFGYRPLGYQTARGERVELFELGDFIFDKATHSYRRDRDVLMWTGHGPVHDLVRRVDDKAIGSVALAA